jgi:hypothetical protein
MANYCAWDCSLRDCRCLINTFELQKRRSDCLGQCLGSNTTTDGADANGFVHSWWPDLDAILEFSLPVLLRGKRGRRIERPLNDNNDEFGCICAVPLVMRRPNLNEAVFWTVLGMRDGCTVGSLGAIP